MQCEMCGRESTLFKADIEGSMMNVCKNCAQHGKVIPEVRQERVFKTKKVATEPTERGEVIQTIVEDYGQRIKRKREKLGLKQKELAKRIAEKESLIHHIESGKFEPNIELARKFERFLRIKLVEEHKEAFVDLPGYGGSGELTIGDLIKVKKPK